MDDIIYRRIIHQEDHPYLLEVSRDGNERVRKIAISEGTVGAYLLPGMQRTKRFYISDESDEVIYLQDAYELLNTSVVFGDD